ncbi:hypothetical protein ACFYZJ_28325 [Streptomyces sp. NPDC001848]|uniref:hypothetical protein n=1 Tax=Streptomyces sp. NPDC001848 TaxID=3364618 RepID=UPI00368F2BF0
MGEFEDQAAVWNEWAPSYNEASLGLAGPVAEVLVKLAGGGHVLELSGSPTWRLSTCRT